MVWDYLTQVEVHMVRLAFGEVMVHQWPEKRQEEAVHGGDYTQAQKTHTFIVPLVQASPLQNEQVIAGV